MKFYRRKNSYVGGVCAGLEDFTGIPAIFWRLVFIFTRTGLSIYLLIWIFSDSQ